MKTSVSSLFKGGAQNVDHTSIDLTDNINPDNTDIHVLKNACMETNKFQEDKIETMNDDNKKTKSESNNTRKLEQSSPETRIQELEDKNSELKTKIQMLENERTEVSEEKTELASSKENLQRQLELNQSDKTEESGRNLAFFKEEYTKLTKENEELKILLDKERLTCDKLVKEKLEVMDRLAESDRKVTLQHNEVILPVLVSRRGKGLHC